MEKARQVYKLLLLKFKTCFMKCVHSRTETEVAGEDITAKMFSDALHLPRAAEEQEKQLAVLHPTPKTCP